MRPKKCYVSWYGVNLIGVFLRNTSESPSEMAGGNSMSVSAHISSLLLPTGEGKSSGEVICKV